PAGPAAGAGARSRRRALGPLPADAARADGRRVPGRLRRPRAPPFVRGRRPAARRRRVRALARRARHRRHQPPPVPLLRHREGLHRARRARAARPRPAAQHLRRDRVTAPPHLRRGRPPARPAPRRPLPRRQAPAGRVPHPFREGPVMTRFRPFRRAGVAGIGLALVGSVLAACAGASAAGGGTRVEGGTITYAHVQEPPCIFGGWIQQAYISRQVLDNLVTLDTDGSIKPWLATSWTVSPDGLTYTFTLKEGVRFT